MNVISPSIFPYANPTDIDEMTIENFNISKKNRTKTRKTIKQKQEQSVGSHRFTSKSNEKERVNHDKKDCCLSYSVELGDHIHFKYTRKDDEEDTMDSKSMC